MDPATRDFLNDNPQEALYIAAVLCGDTGTYHESTLRELARIVNAGSEADIAAASRSKLCNMLYKVSPWTWTSKRVTRAVTSLASKLKLTASAILRNLVMRYNDVRFGNRYARAAHDSTTFDEFKGRLSGPLDVNEVRELESTIHTLKSLYVAMQGFVTADQRFSVSRGAAWFGKLTPTQQRLREELMVNTEAIMNKLERFLGILRSANTGSGNLVPLVQSLQARLQALEARVNACCARMR